MSDIFIQQIEDFAFQKIKIILKHFLVQLNQHKMALQIPVSYPVQLYRSLFYLLGISVQTDFDFSIKPISETVLYDLIQSLPETTNSEELIKANCFCMISIYKNHKLSQIDGLLKSCLRDYANLYATENSLSQTYKHERFILLMTRFNLVFCSIKLKQKSSLQQDRQMKKFLEQKFHQILNQHLGQFHILRKIIDKTQQLNLILKNYEIILFHIFHILEELAVSQNDQQIIMFYKRALERIHKKSIIQFNKNCGQFTPAEYFQFKKQELLMPQTQRKFSGIVGNIKEGQKNKRKLFKLTSCKGSVLNRNKKISSLTETSKK